MNMREVVWEGVDYIFLVENRNKRCALVSTVINLSGPYKAVNFLIQGLFTRKGLCSMKLVI
jgi:hypothetical protein